MNLAVYGTKEEDMTINNPFKCKESHRNVVQLFVLQVQPSPFVPLSKEASLDKDLGYSVFKII